MKIGNKIRHTRKKLGINMKEFAKRVGISYLTLYRVETDRVSPSVALLSDIAHHLGEPIINFFSKPFGPTIVKKGTVPDISIGQMSLQLLLPRGVIDDSISVTRGSTRPGEVVSVHSNTGFELTYILKGKATFNYDGIEYETAEGDLIYFDALVPHSVVSYEPHEFLSIYFRK
jgi:transcriptional regulator with XRE-family HTH domain